MQSAATQESKQIQQDKLDNEMLRYKIVVKELEELDCTINQNENSQNLPLVSSQTDDTTSHEQATVMVTTNEVFDSLGSNVFFLNVNLQKTPKELRKA